MNGVKGLKTRQSPQKEGYKKTMKRGIGLEHEELSDGILPVLQI
jgi:hypothetical protein